MPSDPMTDSAFVRHCLWLIADHATPTPETQLRAVRLAQKLSVEERERTKPCSAEFPCGHCTTCDRVEGQHSAFGMYPVEE